MRLRAAAVLAGKLDWRRTGGSSLRLVSSLLHDGVVGSTYMVARHRESQPAREVGARRCEELSDMLLQRTQPNPPFHHLLGRAPGDGAANSQDPKPNRTETA